MVASQHFKSSAGSGPRLIVLCTWTGAHGRHIEKYINGYKELFSEADVKVIETSIQDLCFRSSQSKRNNLRKDVVEIRRTEGKILLHVFSDGGSNKACELAEAYYDYHGHKLPISAFYLDSTPGTPRLTRLYKATSKSLSPSLLLRPATLGISVAVVSGIWGWYCLTGFDSNVITTTRKRLLDEEFWTLETPRCYLYSKADLEIDARDVQSHAQNSIRAGIPTTEMLLKATKHVQHGRDEPEMYWKLIQAIWNDTMNTLGSTLCSLKPQHRIIAHRTSDGEVYYLTEEDIGICRSVSDYLRHLGRDPGVIV
jgi:hypothetical protein